MDPEQLGRSDLNQAEEGLAHNDRKMLKFSLFWSSQTDFGLLSMPPNMSLNLKKQFFVSFSNFWTAENILFEALFGPKSNFEVQNFTETAENG